MPDHSGDMALPAAEAEPADQSEPDPPDTGVPAAAPGMLPVAFRRPDRRRLLVGLAAVALAAGVLPLLSQLPASRAAATAPSRVLCVGFARCAARGYNSYGYGPSQSQMYWRMFPGDNCTNYAAFVESTLYHVREPAYLLGNGGDWAYNAASHGATVNNVPSVGAVAEWNGGDIGMGGLGHVGVVEQVGPRRSYIVVSQEGMSGRDGYDWTLIRAGFPPNQWQEWPDHFIHFPIQPRAGVGHYDSRSTTISVRGPQAAGPATGSVRLGTRGVIPLTGRWRAGGPVGAGFYNPAFGYFHLLGAGRRGRTLAFGFGPAKERPVIGDWTGAGHAGVGYYDWRLGTFYLREALRPGRPDRVFPFGPAGPGARYLIPLAGDWNGGPTDGIGLYDPRTGVFMLRNKLSAGPANRIFRFGPPHMIPIAGNWAGGRKDGVGYYDPRTGRYYLRYLLNTGRANLIIAFGPPRLTPLAGDWLAR